MNRDLWENIAAFELDKPWSEYGFSTRLASENYWTKEFTRKAILEYKKFMYLAGTSEWMVSPSEVVDTVWHQHLIFTQSYTDFCSVIRKNIQHVPSTHNREDYAKFEAAKERTIRLYKETFGEPPEDIWNYTNMYDSLELSKANIKIRTFILLGVLAFIVMVVPAFFLLKPLYLQIENPDFVIIYIFIAFLVFISLEVFNRSYLTRILKRFRKFTFIHYLHPSELVYLQTKKLEPVVHDTMNQLVGSGKVLVTKNNYLNKAEDATPDTIEEYQVLEMFDSLGSIQYPTLLKHLQLKPVFSSVAKTMEAFRKYFSKSKVFGRLFYLNFCILAFLLMGGFIRFATGLFRDKPVLQIGWALIILSVVIIAFLWRLPNLVGTVTIPTLYKKQIIPERHKNDYGAWRYFMLGKTALAASLVPLVNYIDKQKRTSIGGGDSGDSSCGSSCSSCGGCGGD